jgi:hypothetical protein
MEDARLVHPVLGHQKMEVGVKIYSQKPKGAGYMSWKKKKAATGN